MEKGIIVTKGADGSLVSRVVSLIDALEFINKRRNALLSCSGLNFQITSVRRVDWDGWKCSNLSAISVFDARGKYLYSHYVAIVEDKEVTIKDTEDDENDAKSTSLP